MLQEKALLLSTCSMELGHDEFTASNGWLHHFQQRHMIKCSVLSGEAADVSDNVVEDWQKRLPDICRNYAPEDIFNGDETGLFFSLIAVQIPGSERRLLQRGETR